MLSPFGALVLAAMIGSAGGLQVGLDDSVLLIQLQVQGLQERQAAGDAEEIRALAKTGAASRQVEPQAGPELPNIPGCYAWMPWGCHKQGAAVSEVYAKWHRDEKGTLNAKTCKERGAAFNHWCLSTGTQMLFVPKTPNRPGCYAWRPRGCPQQQTDAYDTWRADAKGRTSSVACQEREAAFDRWCGSNGTRMVFVSTEPTTPQLPKTPGCYAWMPSGCSKQGAATSEVYSKWHGDERGRSNATSCKKRGAALNHWCGSNGTQMLFVPEKPTRPGCYAWRPLGCPQLQTSDYDAWRKEVKGRASVKACTERGGALDRWCGSKGTRVIFVPDTNATPLQPDSVGPALEQPPVPSSN